MIGEQFQEVLGACPHPFYPVSFRVELIQKAGKGFGLLDHGGRPILRNIFKTEIHRLSLPVLYQIRSSADLCDLLLEAV